MRAVTGRCGPASVPIDAASPTEVASYLNEDFERFVITWGLVRDERGSLLEIGANPYFTTVLLWQFTGASRLRVGLG